MEATQSKNFLSPDRGSKFTKYGYRILNRQQRGECLDCLSPRNGSIKVSHHGVMLPAYLLSSNW